MSITIKDVAKLANVSSTTVSFYLNGKFQNMSQETKENIARVIDELDYVPNSVAKGLKTKKSGLIGMIVSDITNPFTSILVKGVNDECIKEGYQLIVANIDDNPQKEIEYIESILQRQAEGIIVNTTGNNVEFLKNLKEKGHKIVLADRTVDENYFDSVTTNNEEITISTVEMLFKSGFEEIGFFTSPMNISSTRRRRFSAFKEIVSKYKSNSEGYLYIYQNKDEMKQKIKDFYLDHKEKKKAAFVVNGVETLNFIQSAFEIGLKIPDDIGVCGFDDWGWNTIIGSGISAISQPSYEVGRKSAEVLIGRIRNKIEDTKPINIELKCELILRGSTESLQNIVI